MTLLQLLRITPYAQVVSEPWKDIVDDLWLQVSACKYDEAEKSLLSASIENRERLISGFSEKKDGLDLATSWVSARPLSAFANVVLGASLIQAGWNYRGNSYAKDVEEDAVDLFVNYQIDSLIPLQKAAELDPKLVDPFNWMISACMGISSPPEEQAQLFSEAILRDKFNFTAYSKYFLTLTEKWGGSNKEMFQFVRDASQQAPRGSPLHILTPEAYMELILEKRGELNLDDFKKFFKNKKYAKELTEALYAWLDCAPNNLEKAISSNNSVHKLFGLNMFGAALFFCDATTEARAVIRELKGQIGPHPWGWICLSQKECKNVGFVYDRACRELGVPIFKN
jgi:hypothetical protein